MRGTRRTLIIAALGVAAIAPAAPAQATLAADPPPPPAPIRIVKVTGRPISRPPAPKPPAAPQPPLSPAGPGTYLLWQKGPNRVSLVRDGRVVRVMPATDNDWKTPNGDYRIRYKSTGRYYENGRWWTLGYFMGFYRRPGATADIGFHRVPNSGSTWYQPLSTVGKPGWTSHGCLRLLPNDAVAAWNFAGVGTVVKVRS